MSSSRPIGKLERLCYERQERDLRAARDGTLPFRFDPVEAERPIQFIEHFCKHHKAEWARKPLLLEEWQKRVLRIIFGWFRQDGTRRFRKVWIEIPRKNGKTELAAGIGLYLLVADGEASAEVYTTATKKEQALICHEAMREMVRASPDIAKLIKVPKAKHANLVYEASGSKAQILSSDFGTLDGLSPHGDLRDEIHAWADHGLAAVLDTAMGSRRQPLTVEITTAGTFDLESVGWQHHAYASNVLNGVFTDERLFAFIAALDDDDDPFDPLVWAKANPNLGVSLKADYIAEQAEQAKRQPSFYNQFMRLHLNRWTQQVTRWLSLEKWAACDGSPIDESLLESRICFGGLDLASKLDLTALVNAFPNDDGQVTLLLKCWLPQTTVDNEVKKGRMHYANWVREGWLTVTPGDVVDFEFIVSEIAAMSKRFRLMEIGFDPHNATAVSTQLKEYHGIEMVEIRQGYRFMSEPAKDLEARIVSKRIRHGGNPLLAWSMGNAVIRTDANANIAPDKEHASDKIDPVVATVMALSRLNVSVYSDPYADRGLLSL